LGQPLQAGATVKVAPPKGVGPQQIGCAATAGAAAQKGLNDN
jgi:hypothetical protein